MKIMITEKQIADKTVDIQARVHKEIDEIINGSKISYESAYATCIYKYLAKLELMIEQKQNKERVYSSLNP